MGLSRDEIVSFSNITDGGSITRMLEELEQCGFIRSYYGFYKKQRDKIYQLKDMNDNLRKKYASFISETKTRKTVHTTMITTFGVKRNQYWGNIQSEVKMDDLFEI